MRIVRRDGIPAINCSCLGLHLSGYLIGNIYDIVLLSLVESQGKTESFAADRSQDSLIELIRDIGKAKDGLEHFLLTIRRGSDFIHISC